MTYNCTGSDCESSRWIRWTLALAGIYNILFGLWVLLMPYAWFDWSNMQRPIYPMIWQSVGMIVGVYGIGYLIASTNPMRYWPIVLIGFLGKVFGPIGFAWALFQGSLPVSSAWITITNDIIWLIPFAMILWLAIRLEVSGPASRQPKLNIEDACQQYSLNSGETLAKASENQIVALVFLRHFGCTFTRQILRSLSDLDEEAQSRGARLVLVHMLHRGEEIEYLPGDVPRIADHSCELYRAFGLGKGSFLELFGPRVWLRGALAIFQGCGVGHLAGDGLQMPGAFLYKNGKILAKQPAATAADLPDLQSLFPSPRN